MVTVGSLDHLVQTLATEDVVARQNADAGVTIFVRSPAEGTLVVVEGVVVICGDDVMCEEDFFGG